MVGIVCSHSTFEHGSSSAEAKNPCIKHVDSDVSYTKGVEIRDGAHKALKGEVIRTDAITDGPSTSEEDSVCFQSTETL